MNSETLFPSLEEEIQDLYKKRLFLEIIKTGKTLKRSGLGLRLYHLAGFTDNNMYCEISSHISIKIPYLNLSLTKVLKFSKHNFNHKGQLTDKIMGQNMRKVFDKYLKDYYIYNHWSHVKVFFDPKKVACWSVLDNDLKLMYPNNHYVNKYGFIYYRK